MSETLIQEIDRLMEGITPGEWYPHGTGVSDWRSPHIEPLTRNICACATTNYAQFVAATPRLLRAAKAEILRQQEELARWKHAYETTTHDDCLCAVNSRHSIEPSCQVHGAAQPCDPKPYQSRICERGTGGCRVRHGAAQPTGEGAPQEPTPAQEQKK